MRERGRREKWKEGVSSKGLSSEVKYVKWRRTSVCTEE